MVETLFDRMLQWIWSFEFELDVSVVFSYLLVIVIAVLAYTHQLYVGCQDLMRLNVSMTLLCKIMAHVWPYVMSAYDDSDVFPFHLFSQFRILLVLTNDSNFVTFPFNSSKRTRDRSIIELSSITQAMNLSSLVPHTWHNASNISIACNQKRIACP